MYKTYNATMRGNQIEWETDSPPVDTEAGVKVQITVLKQFEGTEEERKEKLFAALEKLAHEGKTPWPEDPAAWQREIRQDRPLPGRE